MATNVHVMLSELTNVFSMTRRAFLKSGTAAALAVMVHRSRPAALLLGEGDSPMTTVGLTEGTALPGFRQVELEFGDWRDGWRESTIVEVDFNMTGLMWDREPPSAIGVRTRSASGSWSEWTELAALDAPESVGRRPASEPYWAGVATALQYRISESVVGLRAALIVDPATQGLPAEAPAAIGVDSTIVTDNGVVVNLRSTWDTDDCRNPDADVHYSEVKLTVVHHTAATNDYSSGDVPGIIRSHCSYHVNALGWDDIAYNFLVDKFGGVWEGRTGGIDMPVRGAHSAGFNTHSSGVAMLGDFSATQPTSAALDNVGRILGWKLWLEGLPAVGTVDVVSLGSAKWPEGTLVTLNRVNGHRDVQSTTCPGDLAYDDLPGIRTTAAAAIASLPPRTFAWRPGGSDNCVVDAVGRIHTFFVGTDGHLWKLSRNSNLTWDWDDMGSPGAGFSGSAPSAVIDDAGRVHAFVTASDGHLWKVSRGTNLKWDWDDMGTRGLGFSSAAPAAVLDLDGRIHTFVVANGGSLWKLTRKPNLAWAWTDMGSQGLGFGESAPAAVVDPDGLVHVFVCSNSGAIQKLTREPDFGWEWTAMGVHGSGLAGQRPTAVVDVGGRIHVVVPDDSGELWKLTRNLNQNWLSSTFGSRGGGFSGATPSASVDERGRVHVVVASAGGGLWKLTKDVDKTWAWTSFGTKGSGFAGFRSGMETDQEFRVHVFAAEASSGVWKLTRSAGDSWRWASMGTRGGGLYAG